MWSSKIDLTAGLRYRAIADAIRHATAQGDLRPGDPLPEEIARLAAECRRRREEVAHAV